MAKLVAPLLSFGAYGQIGKTMVTAAWRGVKYARQYVIPSNPQTTAQQTTRTTFAMLREMWKLMSPDQRAPWNAFAQGRKFTGVNALIGENMCVIRGDPGMDDFIGSPGAKGGIGAASIVGAGGGGSGEIDVVFTDPTLPSGWTITNHFSVAFPDQDPALDFVGPFTVDNDAAADPTITLSGLTPSADYCVTSWVVYLKDTGETAYSPSVTEIITATA